MTVARTIKKLAAIGVIAATIAAPAQAHRMWMLPSTFTLSGDEQYITVDGAISNDLFFPNHVPLSLKDLHVTQPDGKEAKIENASTLKFRSVFDLKLDQQGTYKIAETGAMYFASWKEGGETQRRRGTWETLMAAEPDKKADVQFMESRRRVETFVTLGAPTTDAFNPTGKGLELQPITHPNDVYVGEAVEFKFLMNGKPKAGVEATIVKGRDRYRDAEEAITAVTNKDGVLTFTLSEPGRYWINAGAEGKTTHEGREMNQNISYVATFEALPS